MRKSILTITALVMGVITLNATNFKETLNSEIPVKITKEAIVEVYQWSVTTPNGKSSGTALSLADAKRMIKLFSSGEIIIEKLITSYKVLVSEAINNSHSSNDQKIK